MTTYRIPFNRPCFAGPEPAYIADAMARGHISGGGHWTGLCHELLERELGVERALLTTSCTHALEMCALLLGLEDGDEVIVPSFAFVTTAAAFALHGARPVFADVRSDTLNLDEGSIERLVGPRTKAVVVLHYAGVACDMDAIEGLCERRGLTLVEDNAHGLFGTWRGRPLGAIGALATLSFHETKNVTCGEGGALLVNDPALVGRAEVLREKGTDRSRFLRGEVQKYTWVDHGSSWLPSDLLAAVLYAQLEARERIQIARRALWDRYEARLAGWVSEHGIGLAAVPPECGQSWHLFRLACASPAQRDALIEHLRARGILAVFHYLPLHLSPMGRRYGGKEGDCPVAEDVAGRILRLPLYNSMSLSEQDEVIAALRAFPGR